MSRPSAYVRQVNDVGQHTADAVAITPNSLHATVTRLSGFSIRESAGIAGAAAVNFRRGSSSGQLLAVVELAANGSSTQTFPFDFDAPEGVYVEVVSGTVSGVLIQRGS